MPQPLVRLCVSVIGGVPVDFVFLDDIAVGVDVLGVLIEPNGPVLRVGDHRFVDTLRLTVITVALQVAHRHAFRVPAPPLLLVEDGESPLGVVGGGLGQGLCAGPFGAQLGHHVVELRCAGGPDQTIDRFRAVVLELDERAASVRLSLTG